MFHFIAATVHTITTSAAIEVAVIVTGAAIIGGFGYTTKRILGGVSTLERLDIAVSGGRKTRQNPHADPPGLISDVEHYHQETVEYREEMIARRELGDQLMTKFDAVQGEFIGFSKRLIVLEDGMGELVKATTSIANGVKFVAQEVTTNGGTEATIGDGVKRLEALLARSTETFGNPH